VSETFTTDRFPPAAPGKAGELAGLILARLIAPGDWLYRTGPAPRTAPVARVTPGGCLCTASGAEYPGPRQAITRLEAARYAPIAWQCFTTSDHVNLETLRQRAEPDQTDRPPGSLFQLLRAGLLQAGSELRYEMTTGRGRTGQHVRILAAATAAITDDGWLQLPDGALYAAPSPAAAACCGVLTNGWKAWHHAADGRSLLTLRQAAGITPPPRTGR
jgi:hypothetical protein